MCTGRGLPALECNNVCNMTCLFCCKYSIGAGRATQHQQPVLWCRQRGSSRVFVLMGGSYVTRQEWLWWLAVVLLHKVHETQPVTRTG